MLGSSPRMRGTQDRSVHNLADVGIIPAHAGNTRRGKCHRAVVRDHPRACGEHSADHRRHRPNRGSSPRMRGTPHGRVPCERRPGIIPAHAGNTCRSVGSLPYPWDHPRACGEHELTLFENGLVLGSSPRMRGTLDVERRGQRLHGIIPAHAGNTVGVLRAFMAPRDHPRACGEHSTTRSFTHYFEGSSPRMRGTLFDEGVVDSYRGIIPAHAGNTVSAWPVPGSIRDHPRACGEHVEVYESVFAVRGSSPRMRGTL